MITFVNRRKPLIQAAVVLLGVLFLVVLLRSGYQRSQWHFETRHWTSTMKSLSKPAEIGIFLLAGLYAIRMALKLDISRDRARTLYRVLQVIHVPLASVVLLSATVHGLLFLFFRWKGDFHSWSGLVGLIMLDTASLLGLCTAFRAARWKPVHRMISLSASVIVVLHIVTA